MNICEFIKDHEAVIIGTTVFIAIEIINNQVIKLSSKEEIVTKNVDDKLYTPNDVSEHMQRYHTTSGVIEKIVQPYHRGA